MKGNVPACVGHGTCVVAWPANENWITPPQLHISFELSLSAGMLAISTVGAPTTHGALVTGTHGMGVSTPSAAAVAAATVGFDGDWHIPKGGMFTIGLLSMMLAAGGPPASTLLAGRTASELGATPKLHVIIAPAHTWHPIAHAFFLRVARSTSRRQRGSVLTLSGGLRLRPHSSNHSVFPTGFPARYFCRRITTPLS